MPPEIPEPDGCGSIESAADIGECKSWYRHVKSRTIKKQWAEDILF